MKRLITLVILLSLCSCAVFRPQIDENEQLNFSKNESFSAPPKPSHPMVIKAEIKTAYEYSGGDTSFDTWPHHHLVLKIISGKLPAHPSAKKFDYHTAGLGYAFELGQILTLLFNEKGKLWGIEEITPKLKMRIIQPAAS
ncbi:MAG: hypothetical protein SWQ30_10760 [Thermodesulfobacteriota bacterium]|nr:hypothetical protein [Thermodesulfobacteriota bacterium]